MTIHTKVTVEKMLDNVYVFVGEGEGVLLKAWFDGECTERKLNNYIKKLKNNYYNVKVIRKGF